MLLLALASCLYITDADFADRLDLDGDGWPTDEVAGGRDCDDDDPDAYPNAPELCGGRDEDCDGRLSGDESDDDGDGFTECDGDCDDRDALVHPDAQEICDNADVDEDCDGVADDADDDVDFALSWFYDADGDGVGSMQDPGTPFCDPPSGWVAFHADCDDSDPTVSPFADELCDNDRDDDCDQLVDEECP